MKKILAVLALLASTTLAHAEPEKRMGGLFCLTPDQTNETARNYHIMGIDAALALANAGGDIKCILHAERSKAIVTEMKLVRHEFIDGRKLYLYEATVIGFYFGANRMDLEDKGKPASMKQYVFMASPLNKGDEDDSL